VRLAFLSAGIAKTRAFGKKRLAPFVNMAHQSRVLPDGSVRASPDMPFKRGKIRDGPFFEVIPLDRPASRYYI